MILAARAVAFVGVDVVQRQVDAYNRRDIDGFVACYSDNAVVEDGVGTVLMEGPSRD